MTQEFWSVFHDGATDHFDSHDAGTARRLSQMRPGLVRGDDSHADRCR